MAAPSPILAGLRQRCPSCGEGRLYEGYLKFRTECAVCGQDYTLADTADGPAFFVGFAALILFAPVYFILPMMGLPLAGLIISYAVMLAACVGFCLALLPVVKALMLTLQIHHRAEEARFEDRGDPPR